MSGGSYDYLCYQDAAEITQYESQLQNMSDRLAGLGYAQDAAKETEQLLLTIRQFENRINVMLERLSPIWRAVEWWDSCDTSEDSVGKALREYRGGQ